MPIDLKLAITRKWVHPELGGNKISIDVFPLWDWSSAVRRYNQLSATDDAYAHTTIQIVHMEKGECCD